MGEKSFSHFLLSILITPLLVNNIALRPLRVGITQSNMSTPKAIHSKIFQGVPTPIKYLGLFVGRLSQHSSLISYIFSVGSPTLNPPIAFPVAAFEEIYSHDIFLRL